MSEQNKAVARRFYEEVFNKENVNAIEEARTEASSWGPLPPGRR